MAVIQKLRQKSGLILILMVLAIAAFIGMLLTQDSNRSWGQLTSGNTSTVASVAGKTLDIKELNKTAEAMYGAKSNDINVQNKIYGDFVDNAIMDKEADKVGLGICKDELLDLQFGANPSPEIMGNQSLVNPATGAVDMNQLQQIKTMIQNNTMQPIAKAYWAELENNIIKERLQTKLGNIVSKALNAPTWAADEAYKQMTTPANFMYVRVPFDRVDDKDATVTDVDYEKYFSENKAKFTTDEEARSIEYVAFNVVPTVGDSMKIRAKVEALKDEFIKTPKDSAFVIANNGFYGDQYFSKEMLPANIKDQIYGAPIGTVIGPFVDGKQYGLAKIVDRRSAPDSVRSRHILLKSATAQAEADSLKKLLEINPALWDSLNNKYSTDAVAKAKGGDLDFQPQGRMVAPFNDLIFYKATPGKFYTIATQFGVHIVQVTSVKQGKAEPRIKIASIRELIAPSNETDRKASSAAEDLLTKSKNLEELRANAKALNLTIVPSSSFRASDPTLGALGQANGVRQISRWAYESKPGERAKNTFALIEEGDTYPNKYIVAALKSIQPKGVPSMTDVKEQLTPFVKNRKKGEVLKSRIKNTDLNTVAAQFNSKIDTATNVTYNVSFVPKLGNEAALLGAVFNTAAGSTTPAIIGESGVFVAQVQSKNTVDNPTVNKDMLKQQMSGNIKQMAKASIVRALKKVYDITDNRSKFF